MSERPLCDCGAPFSGNDHRFGGSGPHTLGRMQDWLSQDWPIQHWPIRDKHYRRPLWPPTESPNIKLRGYITASLSSLAARKATFLLALMWMVSPVAGLRPSRAARLRTWRMPSPPMRIRSPFLRCLVTKVTRSPSTASVCFFDISWFSAKLAARCFMVTVGADFLAGAAMDDPPGCRKWPPGPPITMVA